MKSSLEKRQSKKGRKKKKRKEEGEDDEEESDNQPELTLKEEQAKLEQEKEAILKNQALLEEVRTYQPLEQELWFILFIFDF